MKLAASIHRKLPVQAAIAAVVIVILVASAKAIDTDLFSLAGNLDQMGVVFSKLASPDWSYLPKVLPAVAETLQMAITGTILGAAAAIPIAFLATAPMTGSRLLSTIVRGFLNIIRTVPDLLLAALFVAVVGIGLFTGMLAIAVFTFGVVSKLVYEAIDTIDQGPVESLTAVGATRTHVARYAVVPQILPNMISYTLYAFEINVRASTVLGYVGAGGVGVTLQASMGLMRYDRVSVIIISIFVVVLAIDAFSAWARRRLL
ncbi:phosphonate ABC transporter, permease protein PhnE [Nakamurella antarctica]|uniref:Phosphonate ABC transporter, permease protein PhnE n=1 Tax=Nakamurella antarctica TaxID=1902245 RepID=A0A3G8ZPH7_9ACTN|nr:phosphonate ABC transporter, permease protein PhnE [Nakamurella antarctica]AZI58715.1 phosphonate ABC transporter, permease protein PhnE [Nakamurella antarctica]